MTSTKPILFSGPMEMRAILDGRKTQTRRVVTPQPTMEVRYQQRMWGHPTLGGEFAESVFGGCMSKLSPCPYGCPGDLLWVRESWAQVPATAYRHSCGVPQTVNPDDEYWAAIYRATFDRSQGGIPWRSSIHMPKWACRLWLRVTDVRVQRVQEISAKDIIAEGAVVRSHDVEAFAMIGANPKCPVSAFDNCVYPDLRSLWAAGWDSINSKRPGCSWADNPWVWAVTFERTEAPLAWAARRNGGAL